MPRRTANQAQTVALKRALARMHYVIRNHTFRQELDKAQDDNGVAALAEKWGLIRFPVLSRDAHVAKLIEGSDAKTILSEVPSYVPKVELLKAYLFRVFEAGRSGEGPQYRDTLELKVDLSYPQDVLEEMVKQEIRRAKVERAAMESSIQDGTQRRARLEKDGFQLKVYDLAFENKTFKEIANSLRRSVSTVKSAFLSVKRKITSIRPIGEGPPEASQVPIPPTKKELPLSGFISDEHCLQCPICKNANVPEEMCEQAKLYSNQDHQAQRELLRDSVSTQTAHDMSEEFDS